MDELSEPKIYGHNFVEKVWRSSRVGFQNSIACRLALQGKLSGIGDDGTLNYESISLNPSKYFIRHQAIVQKLIHQSDIVNIANKQKFELRQKLNSEYIIGIGGTITASSYPDSILVVMRKLRDRFPEKNISLVVFALKVLEPLPNEPWIHISSFEKESQAQALLSVDLLVNPWREQSQIYFASNRTLDAISYGIPYLTPRTEARVEQLGENYPLFHDFCPSKGRYTEEVENQIEALILKCMDRVFSKQVQDYLIDRRKNFMASDIVLKYENQFLDLWNKKILIVVGSMGVGGVEQYTLQMLQCFKYYHVTLFSAETVTETRLEQIRTISPFIRVLEREDQLAEQYDFAFLNSYPVDPAELARWMARLSKANCKIFPIVHTDIHAFTAEIASYLDDTTGIVTVATKIIQKLEQNTGKSLAEKTYLITPVIDVLENAKPTRKKNSTNRIGYFGRVVPIKGVHVLVKFFCRLVRENPQIIHELHIYGPFSKDAYYQQVCGNIDPELASRVIVHNEEIDSNKRECILQDLDLLVYTTAMDGLPYSYLESMYLGTPVVSTDVGGVTHLIKDGENGKIMKFSGLYVKSISENSPYNLLINIMKDREEEYYLEFKRVMAPLLCNPDILPQMSKNAIDTVFEKFSLRNMVQEFQKIILQ